MLCTSKRRQFFVLNTGNIKSDELMKLKPNKVYDIEDELILPPKNIQNLLQDIVDNDLVDMNSPAGQMMATSSYKEFNRFK